MKFQVTALLISAVFSSASQISLANGSTPMEKRAAKLGYDISTPEGMAEFQQHRQQAIKKHANELGYDLTTKEGRKAYQLHVMSKKNERQQKRMNLRSDRQEQR